MTIDLKNKNIVLIGQFNPLDFDKYFFIKNGLFTEEEISPNSIFSEINAQLITKKLIVSVYIDRVQISSHSTPYEDNSRVPDIASSFLRLTKDPFQLVAIGINFEWFILDIGDSLIEISKRLFYNKEHTFFEKYFNTEDAAFGTYASKQVKDSRLKLEVKPAAVFNIKKNAQENVLHWMFNFHIQLPKETTSEQAISYIKDFDFYKNESLQIISNT